MLSQYDTPPLRDVHEVRQASTNYVTHGAPQHLLVTLTLAVGLLIDAGAIATNSQQQDLVFLMSNRARNHFESLATVPRYMLQLCFMIICYASNS